MMDKEQKRKMYGLAEVWSQFAHQQQGPWEGTSLSGQFSQEVYSQTDVLTRTIHTHIYVCVCVYTHYSAVAILLLGSLKCETSLCFGKSPPKTKTFKKLKELLDSGKS